MTDPLEQERADPFGREPEERYGSAYLDPKAPKDIQLKLIRAYFWRSITLTFAAVVAISGAIVFAFLNGDSSGGILVRYDLAEFRGGFAAGCLVIAAIALVAVIFTRIDYRNKR